MTAKPTSIGIFPNGEVGIAWDDGREDFLEAFALRLACPCAECVDEMSGERVVDPHKVNRAIRATGWEPVGHYAVQFRFTDGHRTGLYTFEYLRRVGEVNR